MKKSLLAAGVSVSLLVAAGCALTGLTGCVEEPNPFNAQLAQDWERQQDDQIKSTPLYPLPTTQQSQYLPGHDEVLPRPPGELANVPEGPIVRMSLQEIVHRAVINSLDIRVASYDTAIDQTRVMEAQAKFDPSIFANVNFERIDKDSTGTFSSFDSEFNTTTKLAHFNQANTTTVQGGFQEDLPAGGQVQLQYQVQNIYQRPTQSFVNPFYDNELMLTLTQPLLQNFGVEVNNARITIAQNTQRVSLLDFRKAVEDTVLALEKAYLQLAQAHRDVATLERLVAASEDTTGVLFHRQQTDVSAVQIQQANSATESRRATLVRARAHIADLSDQIKRLMNDPSFPVSGGAIIQPADDDTDLPLHFNLDDQIETGLENRLELGQQQVRIDSAEVAIKVAKNNLLPSLQFKGSVTSDGTAKGLGSAFSEQGDFQRVGFAAGLQFQYPLGNRAARAIWARSLLQRAQAIWSYHQLVEQVTEDVKSASREVDTSWDELRTTRRARLAAADTLSLLQQQQDTGALPYTPESVQLRLQDQDELGSAEQAEHQAMFNYNFSIASLEKSKGTLLRYNNVILEEEQLPFDMMSKPHQGRAE